MKKVHCVRANQSRGNIYLTKQAETGESSGHRHDCRTEETCLETCLEPSQLLDDCITDDNARICLGLQSVMNSTARLVFSLSKYDHIATLLRQLHWLKTAERIDFRLAVLAYKCSHGVAPSYLADELCQSADFSARRRLRSASSSMVVRRTRLSTIGDRAFPVAAAHVWNGLDTTARNIRTGLSSSFRQN